MALLSQPLATSLVILELLALVSGLPTGQPGYGYSSSYPLRGQSSYYSSYQAPAYQQGTGYQASYPSYPQTYQTSQSYNNPTYSRQQSSYSQAYQQVQQYPAGQQSYPSYPASSYSWSYPAQNTYNYPSYSSQSQSYQTPVYNYMINELPYFGPASSSSSSPSSSSSSSSSSSPSSRSSVVSSLSLASSGQQPAWQGKIQGSGATRCHDGKVLPFRARCNKMVECNGGEDEYDCDWHKRSSIPTISTVEQFKRVLADNENVLIEFFAPWCPACVTFLPELEKLSASTTDIPLTVFKVNTDNNPELKTMFSIDTFPRVLMWTKATGTEPKRYLKSSGLKFEPLYNWVRQQV
eukprot:GFUD01019677.1.p1 GENE.GFUD01019677.1~~GFUD01019677.1.p1  ORF type:complete len:402 (+),score=99.99 GFUD01019677.1:157-1206(+)